MKALVTGWFSFEYMGATAGDLLARDVVCNWLNRAGCAYDVALAPPFVGGVDWTQVDADSYSHLIFVCGPFGRSLAVVDFLARFSGCRRIGVNLSMLEPLEVWNPFHLLLERDSSRTARPDLSLLSSSPKVPVIGVVLIDSQPEYGSQDVRNSANEAILRFIGAREIAAVRIDTRLDDNNTGLRTPSEIEALIARMDIVFTTRMHGLVLALKNGVPVIAVDPVSGGAKVSRQAEALGWPCVFSADAVTDQGLAQALEFCLTAAARQAACHCAHRGRSSLAEAEHAFIAEFTCPTGVAEP
jgi:hypothetical protein